ncbi:MAG: hypothetical protein ACK502_01040 [Alphaproteobacteria bacterium]
MKKTLLFVIYGGGHAHMVYPVVHALRASAAFIKGQLHIEVLGLPAAKYTLKVNGVECFGFVDYLRPDVDADAIAWGKELAKAHHSPTVGIDLEDSIAYLGLCYKDIVTRLGEQEAAELFGRKARHAFYPLTIMERIFDDIKPDMVITSNSPRSEAAAIATASGHGIENLIMTDLFTGLGDYPLKARNITFINAFAKDMFVADGLVDEQISTCYYTGNPAFDRILTLPKEKDAAWMAAHFPQVVGRKTVLHADMPAYWHTGKKCSHNKTEAEVIQELEACYDAALQAGAYYLIRPHPSQDRAFYAKWLENKRDASLAATCDLHELLRNIDVLIARTTTVGLEAAYLHKRIVQLDADFHADLPLAKMGIAWGVNSYADLPETLKNALSDDKKLEKIINQIKQVLPDTPAAFSIARIILEKVGLADQESEKMWSVQ